MSCDAVLQQIVLLMYGEIEDGSRSEIEKHLAACVGCRVALAEERRLHVMLVQRPSVEPAEGLLELCREDLGRALAREAGAARPRIDPAPEAGRFLSWFGSLGVATWTRPSAAFALVFLIIGFLSGWVAMGQRHDRTLQPVQRAEPAGSTLAQASNLKSLQIDPQGGRVNLTYDTLERSSIEGRVADPEIRRRLVDTVRNSSNAGLRLDAIDLLDNYVAEFEVRRAFMRALRDDRNAGARLKALAALDDRTGSDPDVRRAVTDALLKDDNLGVRIRAIDALADVNDPKLVPVMRRLAQNDADPYIRRRSGTIAEAMYARVKQ